MWIFLLYSVLRMYIGMNWFAAATLGRRVNKWLSVDKVDGRILLKFRGREFQSWTAVYWAMLCRGFFGNAIVRWSNNISVYCSMIL